jgi:hypothetical protein
VFAHRVFRSYFKTTKFEDEEGHEHEYGDRQLQQLPRYPVSDVPDWGRVIDTKITAIDGGLLEVWRIEPRDASKGLVVFAHGWRKRQEISTGVCLV